MKNIISYILTRVTLVIVLALLLNACKKDSDGRPDVDPGNPVAERIHPDSAGVNSLLTLTGSGLGDMRSIVFDKNNAKALFYSTLNTENTLIFRIPDTAVRGDQHIIFTNSEGKTLSVPFKVLPFGVVKSAFPTDFEPGTLVTLTGNNLDVVSKIKLSGTNDQPTIVSQSLTQAVIKMPSSSIPRATLELTTTAGDKATPMEFVNVPQAATVKIFDEDFVLPAESWSWGGAYAPSTDLFVNGAKSLKAAYEPSAAWGGLQIGMKSELPLPAGTKYFTFWARGADVDKKVDLAIEGNNWDGKRFKKEITIPAGKWTYFKYDIGELIPGVKSISVIVFQIHEDGKTIYYDNIMFTK
jgi:hypothetical protein